MGHLRLKFGVGHKTANVLGVSLVTLRLPPWKMQRSLLLSFQLCGSVLQRQQEWGAALSPPFLNQMAGNHLFFFPQRIHLCVKMLLRKILRSKVDNCLAKANRSPSGGEALCIVRLGEEPRVEDRPIQPQEMYTIPWGWSRTPCCRHGELHPASSAPGCSPTLFTISSEFYPVGHVHEGETTFPWHNDIMSQ